MTQSNVRRFARLRGRSLGIVVALAAPIATLGLASPALATTHHPKGEFAPFADCPLSNSATFTCVYAQTEKGEFVVGNETVPIKNTITLQGGIKEDEGAQTFIGAEDGNTLSKTGQPVPGGLAGLVKCYEISNLLERIACELIFENGATGVTATTELAAPATSIGISSQNLIDETGAALTLPVKVHLENPLLGSNCYIGSNSAPISLPLTTGTTSPPAPNKPIKGTRGTIEFNETLTLITFKGNSLVNNSFAAPSAEGCGIVTALVNLKLGLPAKAGLNTAILTGTLKTANAAAVKASE
jgi:hypothetical protein